MSGVDISSHDASADTARLSYEDVVRGSGELLKFSFMHAAGDKVRSAAAFTSEADAVEWLAAKLRCEATFIGAMTPGDILELPERCGLTAEGGNGVAARAFYTAINRYRGEGVPRIDYEFFRTGALICKERGVPTAIGPDALDGPSALAGVLTGPAAASVLCG